MYDQERDLFSAYTAKRLGRRELLARTARLGIGAAAAHALLGSASTRAMAADFDWQAHKGQQIRVLLSNHPYADAMLADIASFETLTGITVAAEVYPEDIYFDMVEGALQSTPGSYDAMMTGAYQTWTYGPAGLIEDLRPYLADPAKTNPRYGWTDVLPNLRASTAWSGTPGDPLGQGDAKQWCLPWGYELNAVTFNEPMFDRLKLEPPRDLAALTETAARIRRDAGGPYGIGLRGTRSWATIHAGFLSAYTNFGNRDFSVDHGRLRAAMNTPESKRFHADWVKLIRDGGAADWATSTWYQVGADLGAGASGMIYDADVIGYFADRGRNRDAGQLGFHAFAPNPAAAGPTPNLWIWSLAMPRSSTRKDAAWLWMQWATSVEHDLFGARRMDLVNPVRASVAGDAEWRAGMARNAPGYIEQLAASAEEARIYFTPQPLFADVTTDWAGALQRMVGGDLPVDEALDRLADDTDARLKLAGLG